MMIDVEVTISFSRSKLIYIYFFFRCGRRHRTLVIRADSEADFELSMLTKKSETVFVAETLLPTRSGKFHVRAYRHTIDGVTSEPTAMVSGAVEGLEGVPVRVHDACFTSEVLGSLKCDCAEQLNQALNYISENGPGVVIYLQQEGRGIGLANKIAAYQLQEKGYDSVDANRALGLPDDCREYTSVRNMLQEMGIKSIKLMSNNPRKIRVLTALGVKVVGRIPVLCEANEVNRNYLKTKEERMEHLLDNSWDETYWTFREGEM